MENPAPDFERLLAGLLDHGVEFIVVGGVAAALQGVPLMTLDLDIVHRRTPENIARLLAALVEFDASYRTSRSQRLVPERTHLESEGHQLLITRFGPFDVLGAIGNRRSYDDLLQRSEELLLEGMKVRVLTLEGLIEVKEEVGQLKDRAVLGLLREVLHRRRSVD